MASHEELLRKAAEYVKAAQPRLDAYKAQRDTFVKGASVAADVLAAQGLITRDSVGTFVAKVAEDPSQIWGFVEKLAKSISAETLGGVAPSDIKVASSVDPWEARLFPEYHPDYGQVAD